MRCFLLLGALLLAQPAVAHDLALTNVRVTFLENGTYRVDLLIDLDALALGAARGADSAELAARLGELSPEQLASTLRRLERSLQTRVRLRFDDRPALPTVELPDFHGDRPPPPEYEDIPTFLGLTARLSGPIPDGAESFTLRLSRSLPPAHLVLVDARRDIRLTELVDLGEPSTPFPLVGEPPAPPSRLAVALTYLGLGFEHILPKGIDHILFVLGLFLLAARWRPLLLQVSAFTAAHTCTLGLATYGLIELSPRLVEPLIALSIAWVAVENILTDKLHAWRPWVVFAFGLLHGLGFAGVLSELGLPRQELLTALLSFNVGVEMGQLAVLAGAFLAFGIWRRKDWYRRRIVMPISFLIAAVGLFWAVERTFGG